MSRTSTFAATTFACLMSVAATAAPITYSAVLSGPAESPPNASPGTGLALVTYDPTLHTLLVDAGFSGLLGTTTASHIHCCTTTPLTGTAGVATQTPTFPGFPLGVTAGTYKPSAFDLTLASSWNAAFITASGGTAAGAEARLAAALQSGTSYFNIHTSQFGGGEIRGFLQPATAPEPISASLFGLGLGGWVLARRRRR
jgi:hypothetical protein